MRRFGLGCATLLLVASCADLRPLEPAAVPTLPSVDHHLHLMGPAVKAIADGDPMLPAIEVPVELARLLQARAAHWDDAAALADLYSEDSVMLSQSRSGWVRGRADVAKAMSQIFGSPFRIVPTHLQLAGPAAQIAGYYVRGGGPSIRHVGYFHISARREAGGRWRIGSEIQRFPVPPPNPGTTAEEVVANLDSSGVSRAVVLSTAFWADGPVLPVANPWPIVRAENDWTASEAGRFPGRLVAFCSFNPVSEHALAELERCDADPVFRGVKFSFAMSGVDLKNADHVARLRRVFAAANQRRLAVVAHTRGGDDYTAEHVEIFLSQVMTAAPDIPVQIAHLWGGEGYSESALQAFAEAVAADRPGTRNLYFDVAEVWAEIAGTDSSTTQATLARRIRQIGLDRILFGSDGKIPADQAWRRFRAHVPLRDEEFRAIARNVAPYMR
ncbi:MAG TPA: amidohydrolase family protein [Allosphingosinicella sp.]|nr:amidohydrolase family protein [Allosphingosinicella sp.]